MSTTDEIFWKDLYEWLKQRADVEVPSGVTGFTVHCKIGEVSRIEWQTIVEPLKPTERSFFATKEENAADAKP